MDKNAIKKFAVWARTELMTRVSLKAVEYGITEDSEQWTVGSEQWAEDSINGKILTAEEKAQRQALIAEISDKGYKQVMEEVAYTWFNRFSALRFMEVNGYLPSHVRVFTDEDNRFKPQIITEAIHLELDGLDMEKVYELKDAEKTEELYKYLLIVQCNALNKILPGMFQKIADYTELLLPDNLLREGSVIQQMIELIPEDDWKDAVQIIGWLYQYYNSEKKDDVFAALKKNVKITKENIPAATQLFTPDWIVRYMVENSLGRLWLEGHPDAATQLLPTEEEQAAYASGNRDPEDTKWHYYLEEADQEPEVQEQLAEIRKEYAALTPEQLKVIDPCCGSGHILAYLFDVLMQIYESYGYTTREAVAGIVKNNLYGLDIDDRAAQLAYFAVMMKARQYDRRFFSRGLQPHIHAIVESNHLDTFAINYFCNGDETLTEALQTIIEELHDAKEYGSILTITPQDWTALYARFEEIKQDINMSRDTALRELLPLVQVAEALAQKYDVVVTNPPYMGSSGMGAKLSAFVKKKYPDSKSDLFAVFIEKCGQMAKKNGYQAMITQHAWMFLSSFEKLRRKLLNTDIVNMAHLGARAFEEIGGEVVQTTAFVFSKRNIANYKGEYCHLIEPTSQQGKEDMFFAGENRFTTDQSNFSKIPGSPVAYWVKSAIFELMVGEKLEDKFLSAGRFKSCNDELYLRFWWEPMNVKQNWHCYCKGGDGRKYVGNEVRLINWTEESQKYYKNNGGVGNKSYWEKEGITWATITTSKPSFRKKQQTYFWSSSAPTIFHKQEMNLTTYLAYLNSKPVEYILGILNPTASLTVADVLKLPYKECWNTLINMNLGSSNEVICRQDWDSYETSWDFQHHPLVSGQWSVASGQLAVGSEQKSDDCTLISDHYNAWVQECENRFNQLKSNEEELNRIFIDIYGLQNELTPEVEDKDITVHRIFDTKDDVSESMQGSKYVRTKRDEIVSFISYAVGCMLGRYSLDVEGLAYAGGEWDSSKYISFEADRDNVIPICDDEYFEDDIVGRFVKFVKTVYGEESLDENLKFIADALGGNGQPKEVIRNYFLKDFYSDHCKTYQKRPIYWLFDSGKKNGFKALIYMHRYQPDTIARIRTDYVHEQQARYRTAIADLEQRMANAATSERVKLKKKLTALQAQDTEIRAYEEKIHHLADQMISIDLDDGVKKNYAIFKDVLAKIK